MITVLTTILGMLPIAFGWGSGAEILQPLGIAVSGGLWISTILTLYTIPLVLLAYERFSDKWIAMREV
jgi:multidrug efflux pump subunit AcrB